MSAYYFHQNWSKNWMTAVDIHQIMFLSRIFSKTVRKRQIISRDLRVPSGELKEQPCTLPEGPFPVDMKPPELTPDDVILELLLAITELSTADVPIRLEFAVCISPGVGIIVPMEAEVLACENCWFWLLIGDLLIRKCKRLSKVDWFRYSSYKTR